MDLMDKYLEKRLEVLMITEGTYPFHWGGVSTWCHLLLRDLPNIDFSLLSLVGDPSAVPQFTLPANVVDFRPTPLWGIREVLEERTELSAVDLLARRQRTTESAIRTRFIPHFSHFLEDLFSDTGDPEQLGQSVHALHRFFLEYDFDTAWRSRAAWRCFVEVAQEGFPRTAARHGYPGARYQLSDLTICMQWLYRWFFPIGKPLPKVDVAHAAMAGICSLVAVAVKYEHGAAFLLTEHGIYLRERYLAEATTSQSLFQKLFSLRFARRMTELSYALADMVAPCCDYNQRWERRNGADPERIQTIYYGVDSDVFTPQHKAFGEPPVVAWVGRIDPLKDLLTLIQAAAVVHQSRPDIEFRLFGSAPAGNESYYQKCLDLRKDLGLEETVVFAGYRANAALAFNEGDVVVLSSVSEAFPFAILEAMLCEKPVVATAVGGVPEQIKGCGIAVEPRNPEAMAAAILSLMNNPEMSKRLGQAAREKATQEYSMRQSGAAHENAYRRVIGRNNGGAEVMPLTSTPQEIGQVAHAHAHSALVTVAVPANLAVFPVGSSQVAAGYGEATIHSGAVEAGGMSAAPSYSGPQNGMHNGTGGAAHNGTENGSFSPSNHDAHNGSAGRSPNGSRNGWHGTSSNGSHNGTHDGSARADGYNVMASMLLTGAAGEDSHSASHINGNGVHGPSSATSPIGRAIHEAAIAKVAAEISHRDVEPIDALEITALLESMGTTDEVAAQRYGTLDAFDLGHVVLQHMRAHGLPARDTEPLPPPSATRRETLTDYAKGPLALLPPLLLLTVIAAFSILGGWPQREIMLLSAGMTCSLLITSGFVQAISRRTSFYLGLQKPKMASHYYWLSSSVIMAIVIGAAILAVLGATRLGLFSGGGQPIFIFSFVSLTTIWMAAGGLSLVQRAAWLSVGLATGIAAGLGVHWIASPWTQHSLALGTIVGYSATMLVILEGLRRGFAGAKRGESSTSRERLPSIAYMTYEGAPYFGYGFTYMILILLPHVFGWLGALPVGLDQMSAVTNIEVGLTLSMPPLILAYGVADHAIRLFWRQVTYHQVQTPGSRVAEFGAALCEFSSRQRRVYLLVLTGLTVAAHLAFRAAIHAGLVSQWLHQANTEDLSLIFNASLIAYWLIGLGLFNSMFLVTLGSARTAFQAVLWGTLVMTILGFHLATISYAYAAVAFVLAAFVFALASWGKNDVVLQSADFQYTSAL